MLEHFYFMIYFSTFIFSFKFLYLLNMASFKKSSRDSTVILKNNTDIKIIKFLLFNLFSLSSTDRVSSNRVFSRWASAIFNCIINIISLILLKLTKTNLQFSLFNFFLLPSDFVQLVSSLVPNSSKNVNHILIENIGRCTQKLIDKYKHNYWKPVCIIWFQ